MNRHFFNKKWEYKYSYNNDTCLILDISKKLVFTELTFVMDKQNYQRHYPANYPKDNKYKNVILYTHYQTHNDTATIIDANGSFIYLGRRKFDFTIIKKIKNRMEIHYSEGFEPFLKLKHVYKSR